MWTDPAGHVWTTGEVVTSANMNTYIKDNLLALYSPPSCRAFSTAAAQSPASGFWLSLAFNAERYNVAALHSTAAFTQRMTAPWAGRYSFFGHLEFALNVTGYRVVRLLLNGTTAIATATQANTQNAVDFSLSTEYMLAVNDYVELQAWQNSGGALAVNVLGNYSPEFAAAWRGN